MSRIKNVSKLLLALLCSMNATAATQPNILLIYVDDLGYGDLASFGHPVLQTPSLDALADSGLTFTNYYAPSALCSPSRAGLLTGRYPYRTGIKSWIPEDSGVYLREEEITLAEVLKSVGYRTALMGKWHLNSDLGSKTEPQPRDQGFDAFYGHNAFQIPTNHNPTNIYRDDVALGMQEGYTADLYVDEAIRWLEGEDGSKPFFLYLSMAEPHTSIENPPEYNQMYADFTTGEVVAIPNGGKVPPKDQLIPRGPGEYYANITYMDAQLGRMLEWLKTNDLEDDTVVIFTSDNGPVTDNWINWWEVNAYGSTGGFRGRKHFLYEGGIKVPAIIRYPGVTEAGTKSNALVVGTDLFVTLAKLGGGQVPQDRPIDGIDISAALTGGQLPDRSLVWALEAASELEYAVRDGDWKLFLDRQQQPKELYNLAEDPLEFFNLLKQEGRKAEELVAIFNETWSSIESDSLRP